MDFRDRIHLRDYVVAADIGAFQSEKGREQRLRFSVHVTLREAALSRDDHVDSVLSYDVLTEAVTTALAEQRYNLVETLAEHIAALVLVHPRAALVEVGVEKLDRGPGALGVTIIRDARCKIAVDAGAGDRAITTARIVVWDSQSQAPATPAIIVPRLPDLPLPAGGDRRRIALLALDQAAWVLAGQLALEVTESRTELIDAIGAGRSVIWAPARLAADATGVPADPSALADWLAARLNIKPVGT